MGCLKLNTEPEYNALKVVYSAASKSSRGSGKNGVETGYYYFGARYYDPRTSTWLSVDPLASKYPHASPYNYCEGNPVNRVDPFGMDWVEDGDGKVYWDKNATSQKTTKKGETYRGTYYARTSTEKQDNGGQLRTVELYSPDQTSQTLYENEFEMFRFPESGVGFDRYTGAGNNENYTVGNDIHTGDNYVNGTTAVALFNTIQEFHASNPGVTIHYGDISAYDPSINLKHQTHYHGMSIDIHYFNSKGGELTGMKAYKNADIELTNSFFQAAQNNGFLKNYSYGSRFTHSGNNNHSGHKDHLHIGR